MFKSLIYHFYTFEGFQNNMANKAHFFLMEKYFHVFDKIIFYIALDDIGNFDLMHETQNELVSHVKNNEIIFKIIKKTDLCECETFKLGILDNENNLDGSVFFAHNKGVFNVLNVDNIPNVLNWIHCLYFYSLNEVDLQEMSNFFYIDYQSSHKLDLRFYGPCLTVGCETTTGYADTFFLPRNKCMYSGTFYWININKYMHDLKTGLLEKPIMTDRSVAEKFPGENGVLFCNLMSRGRKTIDFTFDFNPYANSWDKIIENFGDFDNYTKEHFEMLMYIDNFKKQNLKLIGKKTMTQHTIKTTLIFHLYVFDGCFDSLIYKAHKFLLDKYSNVFDVAKISICVDDVTNIELIHQAQVEMCTALHCNNIQFTTISNTALGEVQTFKNEIIDNIHNIDGSVFFAHGKGITNANSDSPNIKEILNWVHALYFYSLNYFCNIEDNFYKRYPPMHSNFVTFYGPCLRYHYNSNIQPWDNKSTYMGTFYWFNGSALRRLVEDGKFDFPEIDNRYYAEMFPTLFGDYPDNLTSHNMVMLSYDFFNPYWGDWKQYISWFGDADEFNIEHDELLKEVNYHEHNV